MNRGRVVRSHGETTVVAWSAAALFGFAFWLALALGLSLLAVGAAASIGDDTVSASVQLPGGVLLLAGASRSWWLWRRATTTLTASAILMPSAPKEYREIPLDKLLAVSAVCTRRWSVWVWLTDGTHTSLGFAGDAQTWKINRKTNPPAGDWRRWAESPFVAAAIVIYQQAMSAQGPNGPLAGAPSVLSLMTTAGKPATSSIKRFESATGEGHSLV